MIPNLQGLQELRFTSLATFAPNINLSSPVVTPSLRILHFSNRCVGDSSTPYSSFYSPSLTHLAVHNIAFVSTETEEYRLKVLDLAHLILQSSSHLTCLDIPTDFGPMLVNSIGVCTNLQELTIGGDATSLVTLAKEVGPAQRWWEKLNVVRARNIRNRKGGELLEEKVRERGIKYEYFLNK